MQPLRILTWNVDPAYLSFLAYVPHEIYLPVDDTRTEAYSGKTPGFPWRDNVHEVRVEELPKTRLDCVLFQAKRQYLSDQYEILSREQLALPRVYLEHGPPREHATDAKHPVRDADVLLVHETHYSDIMWDAGSTPTRVIEPGVVVPDGAVATMDVERGLVLADEIRRYGRRLGEDIWDRARGELPLDLIGAGWKDASGLGEVPPSELPYVMGRYRLLFHPARHASLELKLCEAMMLGLPVVGLATGDLASIVENGMSGYLSNDVYFLIESMRELLHDPRLARRLGEGARRFARERFDIRRFADDWDRTFRQVAGTGETRNSRFESRDSKFEIGH